MNSGTSSRKGGRVTRTDLTDEASIALLAGDDTRAKRAIDALLSGKHGATKPLDHLLAVQLAIRQGAAIEAHDTLQKVFADPQATSREKLQAALLLGAISGGNQEWRKESWSWVKKVSETNDAGGAGCAHRVRPNLPYLGKNLPRNFRSLRSSSPKRLEAHPLARTPQKLVAIDLKMREEKEKRDELITDGDRALERWRAGRDRGPGHVVEWQR